MLQIYEEPQLLTYILTHIFPEQVTIHPGNRNKLPEAIVNCLNENENCDFWAEHGECSKNPEWMLTHCKKACNQC